MEAEGERMKINFTIMYLKCNGGNRVLLEIANGLSRRGHEVSITTMSKDADWFPNLEANIHSSKALIAPMGCDIDVATWCFTAYPVALSDAKRKFYYIQMHEPVFFSNSIMRFLATRSYSLPLKMITNSTWLHDLILEEYGKESCVVLNAIDTEMFKPKKVKPFRKGMTILCQHKDFPWKGMDVLFKAMKIVNRKRKVHLVFYGLQAPKNMPGNWSWVPSPSDEDLVNLYNSVDMVVCPSLAESFPLPPLEAMACGTPVVTTDAGTGDYAIDGKNSIVVPRGDVNALAEGILKVLGSPSLRKRLSREGIKTAKKFKWADSVTEVEKIFEEALG